MLSIRYILFCSIICLVNLAKAQNQITGFDNYRNLTVEQGLPSNYITCFTKDADGFMWVGTYRGLVRFDGSKVLVFQNKDSDSTSISGNYIKNIAIEGDSIMWVATAKNGLNKFNLKTHKFKRYYPNLDLKKSLPSEEVIALKHDSFGDLWIGFHRGGFCKYNRLNDNFDAITLPDFKNGRDDRQNNIVKKFIFDTENKHIVWLFTIYDLIRYDDENKSFKVFSYHTRNDEDKNRIHGIGYGIKGFDGKFYIPASHRGVLVFDPLTEEWENYNELEFNPLNNRENTYHKIEQKDSSTFWLGSQSRGLAILDLKKGYIQAIDSCREDEKDQLCKLFITCMDMSTQEGHWIGTNDGLRLYNKIGNQFQVYKHNAKNKNLKNRSSIVSIYKHNDRGYYYGGYAGEGVYYFDINTSTQSIIDPPRKYQPGVLHEMFYTRSILPYNDSTLLVLSDNALFKLYTQTNRLEEINFGLEYSIDYFYLHRLFNHSDGTFYISTRHNGIYRLNSDFNYIEHLEHLEADSNSLISSNYIYEICEDPFGKVWIGTEDGFSVFDPATHSFSNSSYLLRLDSVPQLKVIFSIKLAPDSGLWFIDARANGVSLAYPYTKPYNFKPIITGRNSLAERLGNIHFSKNGNTIITTKNGLSIIKKNGHIERYNDKQGLPALRTLGPIIELNDERIVLGSINRLIQFHPDSLFDFPKDIPIYISSISIFNENLDINLNEIVKDGLSLTYLQNFFSINIGIINYDNPDEYKLSYRLKGLSDEWIVDKEKKAVFTNIPGGSYLFEARILDKNNEILEQNLSMPIKIIPPFWEELWFKILGFSIFLSIGLAFYFIRIRNIKREALLKTEFNKQIANMELSALRAQMNPHFLFNSLNSIRNKIISNKPAEADKYLVKFSRLVRQVLQNSREKLINLKDEMETLNLYVELESSRFDHRFEYELKVAEGMKLEKLKIPPLILQPYVENAIWHGLMQKEESGKVSIEISIEDNGLRIIIEDDGVGRAKAKELKSKKALNRQSMGMGITGDRLKIIENIYQLNCKAEITDLIDLNGDAIGTRITLTLPLIYES